MGEYTINAGNDGNHIEAVLNEKVGRLADIFEKIQVERQQQQDQEQRLLADASTILRKDVIEEVGEYYNQFLIAEREKLEELYFKREQEISQKYEKKIKEIEALYQFKIAQLKNQSLRLMEEVIKVKSALRSLQSTISDTMEYSDENQIEEYKEPERPQDMFQLITTPRKIEEVSFEQELAEEQSAVEQALKAVDDIEELRKLQEERVLKISEMIRELETEI